MTRRLMSVLRGSRMVFVMLTLGAFVAACGHEPSAPSSRDIQPSFAKTASTSISVGSTSPDSATQDTTLDVVVNGSGFVDGSTATWQLSGVSDPTQVRTNSTRYVNSRQLVANITISASATVAKWDVAVYAGTKGGVGTEMFAIKLKPNADTNSRLNYVLANSVDVGPVGGPSNYQPARVTGDGRLRDGTSSNGADSEYQSKFCGSTGSIDMMTQQNGNPGSGNLVAQPGNGINPCGPARYFVLNLNGVSAPYDLQTRVFAIWSLAVGQTATLTASFAPNRSDCTLLEFDPNMEATQSRSHESIQARVPENGSSSLKGRTPLRA
jgi:hypothetical protein